MSTDSFGTTVVLGWDGLDYRLLDEFGHLDSFGEHVKNIDTFKNDIINEPHTREVWPSIITGVGPETHGIYAKREKDGVEWNNSYLNIASTVANFIIPHKLRLTIGKLLRERGAGIKQYNQEYYHELGIETIFDGRRSLPLSIPNYRSNMDSTVGLSSDRDDIWKNIIGSKDGIDGYEPSTSMDKVEQILFREAGKRVGHILAGLQREYDIIFCWFGLLDTAGHIEPAADSPIVERAYEQAALLTSIIESQLRPEDILVCISDHGLREGRHTMDAVLGSDKEEIVGSVENVFDISNALDLATPSRQDKGIPPIREEYRTERSGDASSTSEVKSRLEDLGYI